MSHDESEIIKYYKQRHPLYEAFTDTLSESIGRILRLKNLEPFRIEARTKSVESLAEKISRPEKQEKYSALEDLTDLSGLRIISFLSSECDQIVDIISNDFDVDWANSVVKVDELDPDRFGYQSTHLVISLSTERAELSDFKPFQGLKAEIQIKTLLQHAWAAIDWRLRYKSSVDAPRQIRRRLYRISALLDAADDEFLFVSNETSRIRKEYEEAIERGDLGASIDRESIEALLESDPETLATIKQLVSHVPQPPMIVRPISESSATKLIQLLAHLNINSLEDAKNHLSVNSDKKAKKLAHIWSEWRGDSKTSTNAADIARMSLLMNLPRAKAIAAANATSFGGEFQTTFLKNI